LKRTTRITWICILLCLLLTNAVISQDDIEVTEEPTTPEFLVWPELVELEGEDGLRLVGEFYAPGYPLATVVLLHQLYTDRTSWQPLVNPLLAAGFNVLAVDLRGHGATAGDINWPKTLNDIQIWLNWLRTQPNVIGDNIAIIGSSMGSNLALVGCANDPTCKTAIAISPGINYYGIDTSEAFTEGLTNRSALLIYSQRDRWSALGVPQMLDLATGEVQVLAYPGLVHGMDLFQSQGDDLVESIVQWLNNHRF
jgi:pimeloyl-ACP methyl ester carboxylesterase